ncbi:MAG: phosphoglycerate mutase family protein [archaeon]
MEQVYFIRHGNADYINEELTPIGEEQVEKLSQKLGDLLPDNLDCVLVASESGRAIETARMLKPMLKKKSGRELQIQEEPLIYQTRSMPGTALDKLLQYGKENIALLEKYKSAEYGFFIAHKEIIAATSLAIAEHKGIEIPNFLQLNDHIEEATVDKFMKIGDFSSREEARKKAREYYPFSPTLPRIFEASGIHFDFPKNQINYLVYF